MKAGALVMLQNPWTSHSQDIGIAFEKTLCDAGTFWSVFWVTKKKCFVSAHLEHALLELEMNAEEKELTIQCVST